MSRPTASVDVAISVHVLSWVQRLPKLEEARVLENEAPSVADDLHDRDRVLTSA